jgi:hypothetical protein
MAKLGKEQREKFKMTSASQAASVFRVACFLRFLPPSHPLTLRPTTLTSLSRFLFF